MSTPHGWIERYHVTFADYWTATTYRLSAEMLTHDGNWALNRDPGPCYFPTQEQAQDAARAFIKRNLWLGAPLRGKISVQGGCTPAAST